MLKMELMIGYFIAMVYILYQNYKRRVLFEQKQILMQIVEAKSERIEILENKLIALGKKID
jgi:hypothetical protein